MGTGRGPEASEDTVGIVLAGGGARGAYEIGALSVLLPELERQGQRPRVVVGTSVGALNAAFLAGTAHLSAAEAVERGLAIWTGIRYEQVLAPLLSPGALRRLLGYLGEALGIRRARIDGLLDPAPLADTLREHVPIGEIERNVRERGALDAAAVVATSALTSRSVVFHCGGRPRDRHDARRGIDYVDVDGRLTDEHVRASAAIPGLFPAVQVTAPDEARGWYFDGGTRLNTPIKPARELGARRIVVIALNSVAAAPPRLAGDRRPDALEGAAQLIQAVLVDPLVNDLATLTSFNALLEQPGVAASAADGKEVVPYVFVAPDERDAIGRRARAVFDAHYSHLADMLRSRDLAVLGRAVAGGRDALHGELLSYLFFAPELAQELIALGREDARRWVDAHPDDLWATGPLVPAG